MMRGILSVRFSAPSNPESEGHLEMKNAGWIMALIFYTIVTTGYGSFLARTTDYNNTEVLVFSMTWPLGVGALLAQRSDGLRR